jgi:hypothetical protein
MALPTFRSQTLLKAMGVSTTPYGDLVINAPAGVQAGDLLLLVGATDHDFFVPGHYTLPTGWVIQYSSRAADYPGDYGADGQSFIVLYKVATGAEPASYTFSGGINYDYQAAFVLRAYQNVDNTSPIAAWVRGDPTGTAVAEGATWSQTAPAITTPVVNCLVIAGYVPDAPNEMQSISSLPSGYSNGVVEPSISGDPGTNSWWSFVALCDQLVAAASTVPAATIKFASNGWAGSGAYANGFMAFQIALRPAAGGGTTSYSYTASGGLALSGAAGVARTRSRAASGGLLFSGAATVSGSSGTKSYSYTGQGGVTLSGSAAAARARAVNPVGGLGFSGAAGRSRARAVSAAGGMQLGGSAARSRTAAHVGSGALVLGGSGISSRAVARSGTGGITLAGSAQSAFHQSTLIAQTSGGMSFGGRAQVTTFVAGGGGGIGHLIRRHWRRQGRRTPF